jgi:hypothetical protein
VLGEGKGVVDCRFCHAPFQGPAQAIEIYLTIHIWEGTYGWQDSHSTCPECGEETLALGGLRVRAAPDEDRILCGHCGNHFDAIEVCHSCGSPYQPGEEDLGLCSDCFGAHYARF